MTMLIEFTCKNCKAKLAGGLEDFPQKVEQEYEEKNKIRRAENERLSKEYDAAVETHKKEMESYKEELKSFKKEHQTNGNLFVVVETENGAEVLPAKLFPIENAKRTRLLQKPQKPEQPNLIGLLESHYVLCPLCKYKNFRGDKHYETFYE